MQGDLTIGRMDFTRAENSKGAGIKTVQYTVQGTESNIDDLTQQAVQPRADNLTVTRIKNGVPVTGPYTIDSQSYLHFAFNPYWYTHYTALKAQLKSQVSSYGGGVFLIKEAKADYSLVTGGKTYGFVSIGKNLNADCAFADFSAALGADKNDEVYFALTAESGGSLTLSSSFYVNLTALDAGDYFDEEVYYRRSLDDNEGFAVNIRNGAMLYSKQLIELKGNLQPLNMTLTYNSCHEYLKYVFQYTGMQGGWNFNYNQRMICMGNECSYLDGNGAVHTFVQCENDATVFHDGCGKGLIYDHTTRTLTDGRNTSLLFDYEGRLIKITQRTSANATTVTAMTYSGDLLMSVTDGMGRKTQISYGNAITITRPDGYKVVLNKDGGNINSVKFENDNYRNSEYTYIEGNMTSAASKKRRVEFEYTDATVISAFEFGKTQSTEVSAEGCRFIYEGPHTYLKLYNCGNTQPRVVEKYEFSLSGEFARKSEVDENFNESDSGVLIDKGQYSLDSHGDEHCIKKFDFNGSNSVRINGNSEAVSSSYTFTVADKKRAGFLLTAKAKVFKQPRVQSQLYVKLLGENDYVYTTGVFDSRYDGTQFICCKVNMLLQTGPQTLRVKVGNLGEAVTAEIYDVKFSRAMSFETVQRIDKENDYGSVMQRFPDALSEPWSTMGPCNIACDNAPALTAATFTYRDIALSLESLHRNPNAHYLWFNDGKSLYSAVKNVKLEYRANNKPASYSLSETRAALTTGSSDKLIFEYSSYNQDGFFMKRTVNIIRIVNWDPMLTHEYYDVYGRLLRTKDSKGVITDYTYDDYGNNLSVTRFNESGGESLYSSNDYSADGRYLIQSHEYVGDLDNTAYYYYDNNTGNVTRVSTTFTNPQDYSYFLGTSDLKSTSVSAHAPNTIYYSDRGYVRTLSNDGIVNGFDFDAYGNFSYAEFYGHYPFRFITETRAPLSSSFRYDACCGGYVEDFYDKYGKLIQTKDDEGKVRSTWIYGDDDTLDYTAITNPDDTRLKTTATSKLRRYYDGTFWTDYSYDVYGNLEKEQRSDGAYKSYVYDLEDRAEKITEVRGSINLVKEYTFEEGDAVNGNRISNLKTTLNSTTTECKTEFDALGRKSRKVVMFGDTAIITRYQYLARNGGTTCYPSYFQYSFRYSDGDERSMDGQSITYDATGNIVAYNGHVYTYDDLNRLTSDKNNSNGVTERYRYDALGNMVGKDYQTSNGQGSYSTTFSYDKDRLIEMNRIEFKYNYNGYPIVYNGRAMTWNKIGKLESYGQNAFNYDNFGRLISKSKGTNNDYSSYYEWDGDKIIKEIKTAAYTSGGPTTYTIYYTYDEEDQVTGMIVDGKAYYYYKDFFGNVTGIIDSNGSYVASYTYDDAWGNHTVSASGPNYAIAYLNPFRYRSYYYDEDTGFYYLKSRFYDPTTYRFVGFDEPENFDPTVIGGIHPFLYCNNNPVMYVDPNGTSLVASLTFAGFMIVGLLAAIAIESAFHPIETMLTALGSGMQYLSQQIGQAVSDWWNCLFLQDSLLVHDFLTQTSDSITLIYEPDPFKRPGQKKQGSERKSGARKHPDWKPRSNKRRDMPPKHHTPGRDHKKHNKILWEFLKALWRF